MESEGIISVVSSVGSKGFKGNDVLIALANALGLKDFNPDTILNELAKSLGLKSFTLSELLNKLADYLWAQFRAWIISLIVMAVIALLIGLAYYIFSSISFYKLAKKHGVKYPGLAWIPFLRTYIIGESAVAYSPMNFLGRWKVDYVWLILLLFPLAQKIFIGIIGVLGRIEYIGFIFKAIASISNMALTVAYIIFYLCVLFKIYSIYLEKKHAALFTIASIFVLPIPFLMFSLLKKEKITDGEDFVPKFESASADKTTTDVSEETKSLPAPESENK